MVFHDGICDRCKQETTIGLLACLNIEVCEECAKLILNNELIHQVNKLIDDSKRILKKELN